MGCQKNMVSHFYGVVITRIRGPRSFISSYRAQSMGKCEFVNDKFDRSEKSNPNLFDNIRKIRKYQCRRTKDVFRDCFRIVDYTKVVLGDREFCGFGEMVEQSKEHLSLRLKKNSLELESEIWLQLQALGIYRGMSVRSSRNKSDKKQRFWPF